MGNLARFINHCCEVRNLKIYSSQTVMQKLLILMEPKELLFMPM
jgi:hypothetical protein